MHLAMLTKFGDWQLDTFPYREKKEKDCRWGERKIWGGTKQRIKIEEEKIKRYQSKDCKWGERKIWEGTKQRIKKN